MGRDLEIERVLNAFRHHRVAEAPVRVLVITLEGCSTPFGITASPRARRARREDALCVLNAFRHHRVAEGRRHADRNLSPSCSTPFGITASPRVRVEALVDGQSVLNAFRHHRVAEGRAKGRSPRDAAVLNAFRHHRVAEGEQQPRRSAGGECSTPFGITASPRRIARASPRQRTGSAQRLSASPRRRGLP